MHFCMCRRTWGSGCYIFTCAGASGKQDVCILRVPARLGSGYMDFYMCRHPWGAGCIHVYVPARLGDRMYDFFTCAGTPGEQDLCIFMCAGAPGGQDVSIFICAGAPGEQDVYIFLVPARLASGCMHFYFGPWHFFIVFNKTGEPRTLFVVFLGKTVALGLFSLFWGTGWEWDSFSSFGEKTGPGIFSFLC